MDRILIIFFICFSYINAWATLFGNSMNTNENIAFQDPDIGNLQLEWSVNISIGNTHKKSLSSAVLLPPIVGKL